MNLYFVPALSCVTSQIMHLQLVFERLKHHPETVPCYATYKIKLFYKYSYKKRRKKCEVIPETSP